MGQPEAARLALPAGQPDAHRPAMPAGLPDAAGPAQPAGQPHRMTIRRPRSRLLAFLIDSRALIAAGILVFFGVDSGLLLPLDTWVASSNMRVRFPDPRPLLSVLDHMGQRGMILPVLAAATALVVWRRRRWWPALVVSGGVLAINVIVGGIKLTTHRPSPREGGPALWQFGDLFPSGHAANVVFVYGLLAWLLIRDTRHGRRYAGWLVAAVIGSTLFMGFISIYRATHWFTDLLLGAIIGGLVLKWTIIADVRGDRPHDHDHLQVEGMSWLRRRSPPTGSGLNDRRAPA